MSNGEKLQFPEESPSGEHFASSLELKELASMFAEKLADEETVLKVIEESLLEPIPDLNDPVAVEEYNAKMAILRQLAGEYLSRSELLKSLWEQIEQRVIAQ